MSGSPDSDAQCDLGLRYAYGEGMPQSHEEAARLFEQAAEQGHAGAQAIMGDYCREGLGGVTQDFSAAIDWYE